MTTTAPRPATGPSTAAASPNRAEPRPRGEPPASDGTHRRIAGGSGDLRVVQSRVGPGEWLLESRVTVPRTLEEVFPFFSKAENLNELTPPWVNFKILTSLPIEMKPGAVIDYRIKVRGVAMRWRTVITTYQPPHRFVDEQVRGPYGLWHHTHEFERTPDGRSTVCIDRVRYALRPRWMSRSPLGTLVRNLLVGPDCQKIFEYRGKRMLELFGPSES